MRERLRRVLEEHLAAALREAGDAGAVPAFALDPPRQAEHGDFACNAALLVAKRLRQPPQAVAERLIAALGDAGGLVAAAEVAGPGFVNLWIADAEWQRGLLGILAAGSAFGRVPRRDGALRTQIEFVSANPTGPLTLGHGRQAVLGDCIARLLEAVGQQVTREYYFNDGGRQMRVLGQSVKARYLEQLGLAAPPPVAALADAEAPWPESIDGLPVVFPRDGYQGDYIAEIATDLRACHGDSLAEQPAEGVFREAAQKRIFAEIEATLTALGIRFDVYTNEKTFYESGELERVLDELRGRDLVYEHEGAVWLRATALGLDRDRVLVKGSGEPTYLLPDIAYHRDKFRRGFERILDIQGADHIEQFPFVRAAIGALGCDPERVELVMHQFVTLTSGGQQVKQSTRRANYVTVDELLTQVGADVFRFFMVQRKAEGHLDFDLDLAKERDWKKNPAFYVQYAHARTWGIERKAAEQGVPMPSAAAIDASGLTLPEELTLIRKLLEFPAVVAQAAAACEPHHIAYYLRDVAGLWNPYVQDGTRHRVLSEDASLSAARLALALGVRTVLANGLELLGLSAPERM
ncbi:arginine--tRNA ligase [Myxococcota bacterium]|nr:arginine--tRNA ligase [Myxococcota bacterium]MCZ7619497.1 arginine--tRNA ligase [Myxococcota bacterium]